MTSRRRSPAAGIATLRIAASAAALTLLSGCSYWPAAGNNGLLYTNVTMPIAVLDQEAPNVRTGEACSTGILGLISSGNSSINTAKTNVGITKITTVEQRFTQYLFGTYSKFCTIVSGT